MFYFYYFELNFYTLRSIPYLNGIYKVNRRFYSTANYNNESSLHPNWISGFTDAEGSFMVSIYESKSRKHGWRVLPVFKISLHKRDKVVINKIKKFFLVGSITIDRDYIVYAVKSLKDLNEVIIPFFNKYNLITQKRSDFELFKQIVFIKVNNRCLSLENFNKIFSLKVNLNKGFSDKLRNAFPNIIPVPRPVFALQEVPHPQWLTGFIDGEGCFIINIQEWISSASGNTKYKIWLTFFITQHSRDTLLMESLVIYLDCGQFTKRNNQLCVDFKTGNLNNITTKIIPFLEKYPLQSVKQYNYKNWVEASKIILNKEHLTPQGVEKIKIIKSNMNKNKKN